ncbi:hypothetical protein [Anaeromicropila populeti]|uniref:Uncharacterized protein n=1 Tax=Anaeromicropila populeti TaxID=37658 RepID=A0A1I6INU1_9FIRM|nr:hypothetical protein [Anaeromicropila populeti]SFR67920.1 hypothetical protein SAMN05661086_00905 [Anaeromicropila populeti]
MKYFLIEQNKDFSHTPQILDWFGKIDVDKLNVETAEEIPFRTVLNVKADPNLFYPDILTFPFFMCSKKVFEVVKLFEPNLEYKEIIFQDHQKNSDVDFYYLPILHKVDCLDSRSQFNLNKSEVIKPVIQETNIINRSVFLLDGIKKRTVVMRLDLVEALLRREITGLGIEEIEVIKGGK